jgi:hypothetical protein
VGCGSSTSSTRSCLSKTVHATDLVPVARLLFAGAFEFRSFPSGVWVSGTGSADHYPHVRAVIHKVGLVLKVHQYRGPRKTGAESRGPKKIPYSMNMCFALSKSG